MKYWAIFSLIGIFLPFFAMLAFGIFDLKARIIGMAAYATICLPGFVIIASVIGDQVESGRMPTENKGLLEFVLLFVLGVFLILFLATSIFGIVEPEDSSTLSVLRVFGYLLIQLVVTVIVVLACAKAKAILKRK